MIQKQKKHLTITSGINHECIYIKSSHDWDKLNLIKKDLEDIIHKHHLNQIGVFIEES